MVCTFLASTPLVSTLPATIRWLAAGDSYSSGQGLQVRAAAPCDRGEAPGSLAYPLLAYDDLHATMPELDQPMFVACNGAKTAAFLDSADAAGQPEWDGAMGRFNLVTFTFGGDNIDFSGIITQCIEGSHKAVHKSDPGHTCPADSWIRGQIAQELTTKYQQFLRSVAEQAVVPGGNIVVLGYPELIELPKFWPFVLRHAGVCEGIGTGDATQLRGDAGALNATLSEDVQAVNVEHPNGVHLAFLDVNTGSSNGPIRIASTDQYLFEPSVGPRHNLCADGVGWMNGISTGGRSFHPSEAGNVAEAHLLAEALPQLGFPVVQHGPPGASQPPHGGPQVWWSNYPGFALNYAADHISCAQSFCLAIVGRTGSELTKLMEFRVGKWTTPAQPGVAGGYLDAVSCASESFCMVAEDRTTLAGKDALGNQRYRLVDYTVRWEGTKFGRPQEMFGYAGLNDDMYTRIESISCTNSEFCMATPTVGGSMVWDGTRWRVMPGGTIGTDGNNTMTCSSANFCMSVSDFYFNLWTGKSWEWSKWPSSGEPPNGFTIPNMEDFITALACASPTFCVVAAPSDSNAFPLRWDGKKWSSMPKAVPLDTNVISCSTPSFCLATSQGPSIAGTARNGPGPYRPRSSGRRA